MPVLSYSLTLPQNLYPALERLFSVFRSLVNDYVHSLWNEKGFSLLSGKGSACGILKKHFPKPEGIPSRLYRNALEMAGQIVRSQIERKKLFDAIVSGQKVKASPLFVENVKRQIEKAKRKRKELNYFSLIQPSFSGSVLITSADDGLMGQLKRLSFERKGSLWFVNFEVKVPYSDGWTWLKVRKLCPDKIARLLNRGAIPQAPLIKRGRLSSGYTIYRLVIPFEVKAEERKEESIRILALDLSPSEKRLAVAVAIDTQGHSKPVFFKTEIDRLEGKIDRIADNIHATKSKRERQRLKERLRHLYQEQKLRQRKVRNIRKEVLEIFTDLVVEHAIAYGCTHVAIEDLSFSGVPQWQDRKAIRRFSQWFYSKVEGKLRYKAELRGIKLIKVNPAYTSSVCHKCGSEVEKEGLFAKCSCGVYDRDYNASVNIGIKALQVCHAKARDYMSEATPGSIPFRQGMAGWKALISVIALSKLYAWLSVVYTSSLKAQNLVRWLSLDKDEQEKWNGNITGIFSVLVEEDNLSL